MLDNSLKHQSIAKSVKNQFKWHPEMNESSKSRTFNIF